MAASFVETRFPDGGETVARVRPPRESLGDAGPLVLLFGSKKSQISVNAGDLLETAADGAGATGDQRRLRRQRYIVDVEIVHGRCVGEAIAIRRQLNRMSDLLTSGVKRATGKRK